MPAKQGVTAVILLFARRAALFTAALFVLASLLPYLLPAGGLRADRYEQVYENSSFMQIDDTEMHYRLWGDGNENQGNVLLVHGLGASTFTWRYTAPYLEAEGYRVAAVDLPGFGLSERKSGIDHSSSYRAELLWAFIDELWPGESVHLVGHSMGGAAVTAMAMLRPRQTESLVLAAGALRVFEPSAFSRLLKYPPIARWAKVLGPPAMMKEERVEQLLRSAYGRQPSSAEIEGYYLPLTVKDTELAYVDMIATASSPLPGSLDLLELPVLLIWGEEDAWIPLSLGLNLKEEISSSRLVTVPGEGHCPMETAPGQFNLELSDFLSGLR